MGIDEGGAFTGEKGLGFISIKREGGGRGSEAGEVEGKGEG